MAAEQGIAVEKLEQEEVEMYEEQEEVEEEEDDDDDDDEEEEEAGWKGREEGSKRR